jgi:enterochelin esterase-like enzyme
MLTRRCWQSCGVTVRFVSVDSTLLGGAVQVVVAQPCQGSEDQPVPWAWLLHGWGNASADVTWLVEGLDAAMTAGELPPHVIAAPTGPWSEKSWWVDSAHDDGLPVETAVVSEVLPEVERRIGGPADRARRIVAGMSMGGGAAVVWALRHPDLFGAAALVAPAAFADVPLPEPFMEEGCAFGMGAAAYDRERWADRMSYRRLLSARRPGDPPLRFASVVGDAEEISDYPNDTGRSSLTLETAKLHLALADAPGVSSALRVIEGGHTWEFWIPGTAQALKLVAAAPG